MGEQFDSVMEGLNELLAYAKGDKTKGRSRIRTAPPQISPIKEYSREDIKNIRIELNLTQKSFAEVMGVSVKTVEAWEAGTNCPSGSSSRILEWLEKDQDALNRYEVFIQ